MTLLVPEMQAFDQAFEGLVPQIYNDFSNYAFIDLVNFVLVRTKLSCQNS